MGASSWEPLYLVGTNAKTLSSLGEFIKLGAITHASELRSANAICFICGYNSALLADIWCSSLFTDVNSFYSIATMSGQDVRAQQSVVLTPFQFTSSHWCIVFKINYI